MTHNIECDVLIIGGGPAGSTLGSLLRKYNPSLSVVILESEKFPRDHVGESQLPAVCSILDEIGVWDKVEAAGFPVKIGATYRWGSTDELWHFNFLQAGQLDHIARPANYTGQRKKTAFQVDRSRYDKILLDHSAEMGCQVFEETKATAIHREGDTITGVEIRFSAAGPLPTTSTVKARYYVDATGTTGLLRRAMGVEVDEPTALRNVAIWDYWQNADWAIEIGVGGTKVQIMSVGWGWLWFIPLSETRTSVGLVTSVEYYKASGKKIEELYRQAISEEPLIGGLLNHAKSEGLLQATKDWSYLSKRFWGQNWFLVGDACGFADPILSAGMTLAQVGAMRLACSILELESGQKSPDWIRNSYQQVQRENIRNHIRFADYWYSANSRFTDLKEYCSTIAKEAGLSLDAEDAFQWLGTGGFTSDIVGLPFSATFSLGSVKRVVRNFSGRDAGWAVTRNNIFKRNAEGSTEDVFPLYSNGKIETVPCLRRGDRILPLRLAYKYVWAALAHESEISLLAERFLLEAGLARVNLQRRDVVDFGIAALEAMVLDGWATASYEEGLPLLRPELVERIGAL